MSHKLQLLENNPLDMNITTAEDTFRKKTIKSSDVNPFILTGTPQPYLNWKFKTVTAKATLKPLTPSTAPKVHSNIIYETYI